MQRLAAALLVLGLLVCSAHAQDSDSFKSASSETEVVADSASTPTPAPAPKKAAGSLSVGELTGVVYTSDGKQATRRTGKLGDKLFKGDKLGSGQSVEVSFTPSLSGEPGKPQQAMLVATSKAHGGLAAYAVAKAKKDGTHTIALSTAAIGKQVANLGGELELQLLLGDPSVSKGLSAALGTIELPEGASGADPKPRLLSARHQPINNMKPNIAHTFRPPAKRPPAVVSLAFTGLAVAPLAGLVIYLGLIGVNLQNLPAGASNMWVLMFHGGIAAMLGLYLLFWVKLNLAQTLPLALLLGLFTAATGYKALSAISNQRLTASSAKKTN